MRKPQDLVTSVMDLFGINNMKNNKVWLVLPAYTPNWYESFIGIEERPKNRQLVERELAESLIKNYSSLRIEEHEKRKK